MEETINQLADLSSLRDRHALDEAVVRLLYLNGKGAVTAVRLLRLVGDANDPRCLDCAEFDSKKMAPVRQAAWKDWRDLPPLGDFPVRQAARNQMVAVQLQGAPCVTVIPVGEAMPATSCFLELESARPLPQELLGVLVAIVRVYANLESLLDYGEKDALTELLNRKSFDGAFLKAAVELSSDGELSHVDRRVVHAQDSYWLAVVDIDFFKRVNDNFGHLIGDEVLLLVARLMRANFRFHDQLYRFGGEEFVILMRCADQADAEGALERFRRMVEDHVFPQVGNITVSIGYAMLRNDDTPGAAFGRADKAVYHAKSHGRNQVVSYQKLLVSGELIEEAEVTKDIDFF